MEKNGKKAVVIGMAKSGIASAKLLYELGYDVTVNDMKTDIKGLKEELSGIEYKDALGVDHAEAVKGADLVVLSPVVPIFSPFVDEARAAGAEVIGEIELGYRYCNRGTKFICISGTNGKTTTTALTGELFKAAGKHTFVLGNIGVPITAHARETKAGDYVVAETAALQLESIADFHANAFGMLNITEDHLNRFQYKMENYIAAKCRGFENQTENDFAALNYDDPIVRDMAKLTRARILYFSQETEPENGAFIRNGRIIFRLDGKETDLIATSELRIPGKHNIENALCAICLAMSQGLDAEGVRRGLREFPGVEHRIEFVREKDGVRPTILLLGVGNYDKKSDFAPLFEAFDGKVKAVIASGLNVPAIKLAAEKTGYSPVYVNDGPMIDMLKQAEELAQSGDAVLLSPAAASWGIYDNYEQRGEIFKELVNKL